MAWKDRRRRRKEEDKETPPLAILNTQPNKSQVETTKAKKGHLKSD